MDELQPEILVNKRLETQKKTKKFAFSEPNLSEPWNVSQKRSLNDAVLLHSCWLKPSCEKLSGLIRRTRNWTSRTFLWTCNYWNFPPMEFALPWTEHNNWNYYMLLQVLRKLTDILMNQKQGLVIEKSRFVYEKESDHYQLLALSLHKVCNAMTFYRKVTSEQ